MRSVGFGGSVLSLFFCLFVFAAALPTSSAWAGCSPSGSTDNCTGNVSGGVSDTNPPYDTLNVYSLTVDVNGTVQLTGDGDDGAHGTVVPIHYEGHPGENGGTVTVTYTGGSYQIDNTNKVGILGRSTGGNGGDGEFGTLVFSAADGGDGGDGHSVNVNANGNISTSGTFAHGIVALSAGGSGGTGGDCDGCLGANPGDGGAGGAGGHVTVNLNGGVVHTTGILAYGIFAESAGGGGGSTGNCNVSICSGSSGGNSATGGRVDVTTALGSSIVTDGQFSHGIYAGSIGGFAGGASDAYAGLNFGANAGSAGSGGEVHVTNNGSVTTNGFASSAIFVQSIGGGGGDGGNEYGIVGIGSGGSHGGAGGDVYATNNGVVTTWQNAARGIFAQSIGGSGGSGGNGGGIVSIGGNGSGTSNGGTVTINNTNTIETHGTDSDAIFAQSVGGGGGNGGTSGGLVTIGGSGGGGGAGSTVNVYNSGGITTHGADSNGIFAESIGGGGGNGGGAFSGGVGFAVAIGGAGGDGGAGGVVNVNPTGDVNSLTPGTITTSGDRANGIQAQSVGGGGGNGGLAVSVAVGEGFAGSVALGGTGGDGGGASAVTVNENGMINTGGAQASGIFAQSVGGGGGNGGGSVALAGATAGYSLGFSMGGTGGDGGAGSTVTVNAVGDITTVGEQSNGIFAQSVGGGGGNGGFAVAGGIGSMTGNLALGGNGSGGGSGAHATVTVTGSGTIETSGASANGILVQSVGGGGGNGGLTGTLSVGGGAVGISLGGKGGTAGNGGQVDLANSDAVITHADKAVGIEAQSVGGGGGNGGMAISASGGVMSAAVSVGGDGGGGGNGGVVNANNTGDITTSGSLAYGILAQSVGGGGGNGGMSFAGSLGVSVEDVPGGALSVAVGGAGGTGGTGSTVTVTNGGSVETSGLDAYGIFAQSVGGGGGSGGIAGALSATIGDGASIGVSVGGFGGTGGNAGAVTVTNNGDHITTTAGGADGVHAQSIGGSGGDGGFGLTLALSGGGETNVNLGVAIGGAGGGGGDGKAVTVHNHAAVNTSGGNANGVFAQSVGGGGGNGGFAVSGAIGFSSQPVNLSVAVGGWGGDGSTASTVTVDNDNQIVTTGAYARGILAQSIGGSGGNGGLAITGQLAGSETNAANLSAAVGGGGGDANGGGEVDVTNALGGTIHTTGMFSDGIEAQSVGGGGGNGGLSVSGLLGFGGEETTVNANVTVGGNGGTGSSGGTVHVINNDTSVQSIFTEGDSSSGILAQSIGGGGGNAGDAISAAVGITNVEEDEARTVQVEVAVGGNGGSGDNGGNVTVDNDGGIRTLGASSYGILAQSIGGGGGIGGRANSFNIIVGKQCTIPLICEAPDNVKNNWALTATVGGNGGGASNGGIVTVNSSGAIETSGDEAHGIYAQSVGGGGGAGGNGHVGSGELLPVPVELATIPYSQVGFTKNLSATVGGNAGASGNGGTVEVNSHANITTQGGDAFGILAQSIGGGGGVGGLADVGLTGTIGIGGAGGSAGNGGNVTVASDSGAVIETFGLGASGIFAQSVGGGGGIAGNVDRSLANGAGPIPALDLGIGLALGRAGGGGGNGGDVEVDLDGTIITHGDSANGIFAQSVGGGGGVLGDLGNDLPVLNLLSWHIGSVGAAGDAGQVDVTLGATSDASIYTSGNGAMGIVAQSAGGTGSAGDVNVTIHSTVATGAVLDTGDETRGLGSIAILADSKGDGSNGNVAVNLADADSFVQGGRTDESTGQIGVGVYILDGNNNTLTNHGTLTTVGGVQSGFAAMGGSGDEAVTNYGAVFGSFDLGSGVNSFTNQIDALLNSGAFAHVGDASGQTNLLLNDGTLSPGGAGLVMTTEVLGNWTQGASGTYAIDLDLFQTDASGNEIVGSTVDRTNVTGTGSDGGTADLAGETNVGILNPGSAQPGSHTATIVHADTGVTANTQTDLGLVAPPSAVADYQLAYPDANTIDLAFQIDFAPAGLSPNEAAFGEQINDIQLNTPRPPDPGATTDTQLAPLVAALFNLPDLASLKDAYDQVLPTAYANNEVSAIFANLNFDDALQSCRVHDGDYRIVREGECYWFALDYDKIDRMATVNNTGFGVQTAAMATGAQWSIGGNWRLGAAVGLGEPFSQTDTNAKSKGRVIQAGAVLKGRWNGTTLAATVTGGYGRYDTARIVSFPGFWAKATGIEDVAFAAAHARLAHVFGSDNAYVRPSVDAGVTDYMVGAFDESGSPTITMSFDRSEQTLFTVEPSIEVGGEFLGPDGTAYRPYAQVGVTQFLGDASPEVVATLQGAPTGVAPFVTSDDFARTFLDVSGGLVAVSPGGIAVKAKGFWKKSKDVQNYGGSVKVSFPLN